jgi:hypothetical protein
MSSRPLLKPQQVMTDVVADQNRTGLVTNINMVSMVSYNVFWENNVTGDFSVEVCNDYVAPIGVQDYQLDNGHWVPLTLTTPVSATGTADSALIDVVLTASCYVRLVFTDTSGGMGSGVINAWIAGKVA